MEQRFYRGTVSSIGYDFVSRGPSVILSGLRQKADESLSPFSAPRRVLADSGSTVNVWHSFGVTHSLAVTPLQADELLPHLMEAAELDFVLSVELDQWLHPKLRLDRFDVPPYPRVVRGELVYGPVK